MIRVREGCDIPQALGSPFSAADAARLGFPAAYPRFSIVCSACHGSDASCSVCSGSGEEGVYRCPGSIIDAESAQAMRAFADFESGHLPDDGGMSVQAAPFLDIVHAARQEIARIRAEEERIRRAKQASVSKRSRSPRTPNRI